MEKFSDKKVSSVHPDKALVLSKLSEAHGGVLLLEKRVFSYKKRRFQQRKHTC